MRAQELWSIARDSAADWKKDNATRLSASLAYYTLLSIAPLIVIAITIAGFAFGEEAARGRIAAQLGGLVGAQAAQGVQMVVQNARSPASGVVSSTLGILVLILGASGVFGELQESLNTIWKVEPKPGRGIWGTIKGRFFSFTMVLGVAFLLLVSLIVSAAVSAVGHVLQSSLPGGEALWQAINFGFSFGVITFLFALIFKVIPDVEIEWRDVWFGAATTALLFTLGKFLLGLYLGKSTISSSYGAAGSIIVLVVWVYYSAQILFLGAELTQTHARRRGRRIRPSEGAVPLGKTQPQPG